MKTTVIVDTWCPRKKQQQTNNFTLIPPSILGPFQTLMQSFESLECIGEYASSIIPTWLTGTESLILKAFQNCKNHVNWLKNHRDIVKMAESLIFHLCYGSTVCQPHFVKLLAPVIT